VTRKSASVAFRGEAGENVAELIRTEAPNQKPHVHLQGIEEVVADKGYHSGAVLVAMQSADVRTYLPEKKQKGQRHWDGKPEKVRSVKQHQSRTSGIRALRAADWRSCRKKVVRHSPSYCAWGCSTADESQVGARMNTDALRANATIKICLSTLINSSCRWP
jgi:hypothetical protein